MEDGPTALYRWFDEADLTLYVGISNNIAARQDAHTAGSTWTEFAVRSTVERFATRLEAEAAEIAAIHAELPLFNRKHNDTEAARQRLVAYLVSRNRLDLLTPTVNRGRPRQRLDSRSDRSVETWDRKLALDTYDAAVGWMDAMVPEFVVAAGAYNFSATSRQVNRDMWFVWIEFPRAGANELPGAHAAIFPDGNWAWLGGIEVVPRGFHWWIIGPEARDGLVGIELPGVAPVTANFRLAGRGQIAESHFRRALENALDLAKSNGLRDG